MPTYTIRVPDGRTIKIQSDSPETAVQDAESWAKANPHGSAAYQQGRATGGGLSGAVDTFNRSIPGVSELGAGLTTLGGMADDAMAGRPVDAGRSWQQARDIQQGHVDQFQQDHPALSSVTKGVGLAVPLAAGLATGGATAAPTIARATQGGLKAAAGRFIAAAPRNAITGATVGAVYGASQPGTLQQRLGAADRAIVPGATVGVLAPPIVEGTVGGARAAVGATRALASGGTPEAAALTAEGIPLTPGEKIGGAAATMEDKAMSLPLLGDSIRGARMRGRDALNRAVANRALAPIGETLPAEVKTGNDAVAHVEGRLGDAYTRAAGLIQRVTPDPTFKYNLTAAGDALHDMPADLAERAQTIVGNRLAPLLSGPADGSTIGDVTSQLKTLERNYGSSQDGGQRMLSDYLANVRGAVEDLAARQNPDYAAAKSAADTGWANFVRMRDAASRAGTDSGVFTPAGLKAAVRAQDKSAGKGATARGDALMFDLANNADQVMGAKIPDSGTAGRLMMNAMLLGGTGHPLTSPVATPAAVTLGAASLPYLATGRGVANAFEAADPSLVDQLAARGRNAITASPVRQPLPRSVTALSFVPAELVGSQQQPDQGQ